jgi:DHA1 family tetracycline resistance protein-like MFS transporter
MPLASPPREAQSRGSRGSRGGRAAFAFIFVTVALDMLALGVMIPVLPKLIVQLEGGDIAQAAAVTGGFGFVWNAMQFLFSPLVGALSDRFGRRPVVLLSNLGLGLDYILMALAPNLAWLFVGRVVSGITAASFSTATAYIADITPAEGRARLFGMIGAAFGLGFIVGPALGGALGTVSLRLPFWVAAGLSLTNAAYGFFVLPESLPADRREKLVWAKANPLGSIDLLRSQPAMLGLALVVFLDYVAHESLPSCFVLYADYRYGWGEGRIGAVLAAVGFTTAAVQALLVGPMVRALGERRALLLGTGFGVAAFAAYGAAPTGALFMVGIPFAALWGIAAPAMQTLLTRRVGPSEQGRLQGALGSLRGIGGMIGPILFTQTLAAAIRPGAALVVPGAPYLLAAALLVVCVAWAAWTTRGDA